MKKIISFILLAIPLFITAQDIKWKNGDLIFQESCTGNVGEAIKSVTTSVDKYHFTHVGIVYIDEKDSIYVLEATIPKVALTPLSKYLHPMGENCYPKSVVGRIKPEFQNLIPQALNYGLTLIGKDYDYGYKLDNDKYYCSELIYEIFKHANNSKDLFSLNIMTFKSLETGKITDSWLEYFESRSLAVPEGELGINPGAMSRSDVLDIIREQ